MLQELSEELIHLIFQTLEKWDNNFNTKISSKLHLLDQSTGTSKRKRVSLSSSLSTLSSNNINESTMDPQYQMYANERMGVLLAHTTTGSSNHYPRGGTYPSNFGHNSFPNYIIGRES